MGHNEHTWQKETGLWCHFRRTQLSRVTLFIWRRFKIKYVIYRIIHLKACLLRLSFFLPPVRTPTWLKGYHRMTVSRIFCLLHTERKSFSAVGLLLHLVFHLGSLWTCSHVPGPLVSPQMAWNSHLMQYYSARPAAGSNNRPARSQHVTRRAGHRFGETRRQPKGPVAMFLYIRNDEW